MSNVDSGISPSSATENTTEVGVSTPPDPIKEDESMQQKDGAAEKKSTKEPIKTTEGEDEIVGKEVSNTDSNEPKGKRGAVVSAETIHDTRRKASGDDDEPTGSKRRRTTSSNVEMPTRNPRTIIKGSDNNDDEEVIREKCIAMLLKCMGNNKEAEEIAKKVELAIFNEIGDANDHKYRSRVRSRVANLTRNPAIGKQILDGVIAPEKFARMTAEELATPQLKELREHLSEGTMVEHMMGEKEAVGGENIIKSDNAI